MATVCSEEMIAAQGFWHSFAAKEMRAIKAIAIVAIKY